MSIIKLEYVDYILIDKNTLKIIFLHLGSRKTHFLTILAI